MIRIRMPEEIHQAEGQIAKGRFRGRWHFAFDEYYDPRYTHFGALRVFNDDTLDPGAVWPLHPHREIEVVTYCAEGEFRHADEHGAGNVLKKGWVQHTTVGRGMYHSEINNREDGPMRFIQMWFRPSEPGLTPSVEQKAVEPAERTNRFLPLVSMTDAGALPIHADGRVSACFLQRGQAVRQPIGPGRGGYLYVLEGGPVEVNGEPLPALAAAMLREEPAVAVRAEQDAELLFVEVGLG